MTQTISGHMVERILSIGSVADGEYIQVTFAIKDDAPMTLFFPLAQNAHTILALMTGGGAAYEEQVRRLGETATANLHGFTRFQPSEAQVLQAVNPAEERLVVLRLKHKGYPAVDVELSTDGAKVLADALSKTLAENPPPAPKIQ